MCSHTWSSGPHLHGAEVCRNDAKVTAASWVERGPDDCNGFLFALDPLSPFGAIPVEVAVPDPVVEAMR